MSPHDEQLRPRSVVKLIAPMGEAHYVLEDPTEIRQKLGELREHYSMGLGVDDGGEGSGLLILTGLDVVAEDGGRTEPFSLALHPGMIAVLREVTDDYWRHVMEEAEQTSARREDGPHGLPFGLGAINLGELLGVGQQPPQGGEQTVAKGTEPAFTNSTDPGTVCCCSHTAAEHEMSGGGEQTYFHGCKECGCGLFHTHDEEE